CCHFFVGTWGVIHTVSPLWRCRDSPFLINDPAAIDHSLSILNLCLLKLSREISVMSNDGVNQGRRRVLTAMTSVVGAAGVVGAAVPFVGSWNPSAKAKAAGAPVEINVSKLEPGQMITVEWRGKPVYIVRRTAEALAGLKVMESELRDP